MSVDGHHLHVPARWLMQMVPINVGVDGHHLQPSANKINAKTILTSKYAAGQLKYPKNLIVTAVTIRS